MTIQILISKLYTDKISPTLLEQTVAAVLENRKVSLPCGVSVVIESDEEIRKFNMQYRGIDASTDVLSFASDEIDPENGELYLGDILISLPRAEVQAEQAGHTLENEIRLLVIHGMLHLLAFDHSNETEKRVMWKAQAELLKSLHIEIAQIPED